MVSATLADAGEFEDLLPRKGGARNRAVTISSNTSKLSVRAWRSIGTPSHIRILVSRRTGTVKFVPATEEEATRHESVVPIYPDGTITSRLSNFARDNGYLMKRYPAEVEDGALVFRLERDTVEKEQPTQ